MATYTDRYQNALEDARAQGVSEDTIRAMEEAFTNPRYNDQYDEVTTSTPGKQTSGSSSTTAGYQSSDGTQSGSSNTSNVSYQDLAGVRRNPDGTANLADVQRLKKEREALINGAYTLSDAIGADREKLRKQREAEAAQNRKRAKVAAFTDSARLLSDIISAGMGGNVYARNADTTAKEMSERNKQLRELQAAEDAQQALQQWQMNRDRALAILASNDAIDQRTAVSRSSSNTDSSSKSSNTSISASSTDQTGWSKQEEGTSRSGYQRRNGGTGSWGA